MDFYDILFAIKTGGLGVGSFFGSLFSRFLGGGGGGSASLVSISAVYTQSGTVYDVDLLDDLKADLVVTASRISCFH